MNDKMFKKLGFGIASVGVVGLVSVLTSMPAYGQEILDEDLCDKAVAYSVKYIPEEDGAKLHQARWNIIEGNRTDDAQKLITLVVFEMGQRIGYSYDQEVHGDGPEWIEKQVEVMRDGCEKAIVEIRGDQYGEFESANPDEAW